jgi:transcriptional regulator with XRE-family HTH domain
VATKYGKYIRQAREAAGLSQTELAEAVGVEGNQVSRWERDVSPPGLENFDRIATATDRSLDELAGKVPIGIDLSGQWFAAWETWRLGLRVINTHGLVATHHGERVKFEADGDYEWYGDFRFRWHQLKGDYVSTEAGRPAGGVMFLPLTADRQTAFGPWAGITGEGKIGKGWGVISRSESYASDLLKKLIHDPESVTEWPIELAGV